MEKVTVLGVGNILLSDEGFGVRVVEHLLRCFRFPANVEVIDGGTMGYELLRFLHGTDKLILVDAIKGSHPPGSVYRFTGEEVKTYYSQKVSMHQLGIQEVLTMLNISEKPIAEMVVLGVQPASLEMSLDLSLVTAPLVETISTEIVKQLSVWNIPFSPLTKV